MNNLPPGVTGHEPQIAGYPVREMTVACQSDVVPMIPKTDVLELINEAVVHAAVMAGPDNNPLTPAERLALLRRLQQAVADKAEEVEQECEWEGSIEGDIEQGSFWWECPRCGTEQETVLPTSDDE